MVKAELSYNPYLLETEIKFNGHAPRINSLVEKHQKGMLQNWIKALPGIFHDEMNGYDFELEFSGTARDFSELESAFKQANVISDQVKLFHKSELEERVVKLQRIDSLLNWLRDNPNRNFDNIRFRTDNTELFDGAYPFIVIQDEHTEVPIISWADAAVETIGDIRELDNTDLKYTPIIMVIDKSNVSKVQQMLKYFKRRNEIIVQQLFFLIDEALNRDTVVRTIRDLGIKTPNVIKSFDDEKLKKFFEIYPETDYILKAISLFNNKANTVEAVLIEERAQGEKINTEIDEKIHSKDDAIRKAVEADEELNTKINIDKPAVFTTEMNNLFFRISIWRKKKTKSVSIEEAEKLADELLQETAKYIDNFAERLTESATDIKESIDQRLLSTYESSGCEDGFVVDQLALGKAEAVTLPDLKTDLLEMHVRERVRKNAIGLFAIANNLEEEYEIQTAFYFQKWREYIFSIVEPIAERLMDDRLNALAEYNDFATEKYSEHLKDNIAELIRQREILSQQLSSEEKQLQNDVTWLNDFKQQIKTIERG